MKKNFQIALGVLFAAVLVFLQLLIFLPADVYALEQAEFVQYNKINNNKLTIDKVEIVCSDPDGGIWFLTQGGGAVYRSTNGEWINYREGSSGLKNNFIKSFAAGNNGVTYFGFNNGVSEFLKDGKWKSYNSINSELKSDEIIAIAVDNNNGIWYSSRWQGVSYKLNDSWKHYSAYASGLPSNDVTVISVDGSNSVWFGLRDNFYANQHGGAAYLKSDGTWLHYKKNNSGLPSDVVNDILIADDGSVWFATNNGLAHLSDNKWKVYDRINSKLVADDIKALAKDENGFIWAATWGSGIAKVSSNTKLQIYTEGETGLPNNFLYDLSIDKNGNLWVGSNEGVTWIKRKDTNSSKSIGIPIYIDGSLLSVDVPPVIEDSRTLVSMRQFFEKLKYMVEWVPEENKIVVSGLKNIEMTINSKNAVVNGNKETLDAVPKIINGRTMVPLRWIGETLGFNVHWNSVQQTINLY